MRIIRWIFGIPLAFAIIIGISSIVAYAESFKLYLESNIKLNVAFHFAFNFLTFSGLVFLSCLFVPTPKKIAAIISITIAYVAIAAGSAYVFITEPAGLNIVVIAGCSGIVLGLASGFVFSYKIFKNKGWNKTWVLAKEQDSY
jgi:hypothetical protein